MDQAFSVSVSILTNKQTKKLKTKEFEEEKNYRLDFMGKKEVRRCGKLGNLERKRKKNQ